VVDAEVEFEDCASGASNKLPGLIMVGYLGICVHV